MVVPYHGLSGAVRAAGDSDGRDVDDGLAANGHGMVGQDLVRAIDGDDPARLDEGVDLLHRR